MKIIFYRLKNMLLQRTKCIWLWSLKKTLSEISHLTLHLAFTVSQSFCSVCVQYFCVKYFLTWKVCPFHPHDFFVNLYWMNLNQKLFKIQDKNKLSLLNLIHPNTSQSGETDSSRWGCDEDGPTVIVSVGKLLTQLSSSLCHQQMLCKSMTHTHTD